MENLSISERELVAIGAALGSNCVPCIEYHIPEARKAGLSDQKIDEAVRLADKVRQVPARKVFAAAMEKLRTTADRQASSTTDSGCGQPAGSDQPADATPGESGCAGSADADSPAGTKPGESGRAGSAGADSPAGAKPGESGRAGTAGADQPAGAKSVESGCGQPAQAASTEPSCCN